MGFYVLKIAPCESYVFCTLSLGPCILFPLSYSCSNTPDFFEMMNFFGNHFSHVYFGFPGQPTPYMKPRSVLPFTTVQIISFLFRADSAFSTAFPSYISDWLLRKVGCSSLVGRESHAASGKVVLT